MRALWRASIWAPDAIPASEGELARDVKRWVLPTIDTVLIIGSILALFGGVPTFEIVYNSQVAQLAAVIMLAASTLCLIGVSFPRLWLLEMCAKCLLSLFLVLYAILLVVLSLGESPARGVVGGISAGLAIVLLWRIVWLGREHRRRVALARAATGGS